MAGGMLPGVEAARRRRVHISNGGATTTTTTRRPSNFCLYATSNHRQLIELSSSQGSHVINREDDGRNQMLDGAAARAKKRLDLRFKIAARSKGSQPSLPSKFCRLFLFKT